MSMSKTVLFKPESACLCLPSKLNQLDYVGSLKVWGRRGVG